jgi:hypothetical protein
MKHLIPLLTCIFCALFALSFPACKEKDPTVIEGTIFDAVTKKPIKSASINYVPYDPDVDDIPSSLSTFSDSLGHYRMEAAPELAISSISISKTGYQTIGNFNNTFPAYKRNEYSLIDIYLNPK